MFFQLFLIIVQLDPSSLGKIRMSKECFIVRNDTLVYRIEKVIFINSETAREKYGTVVIPFDDSRQKVRVLYARTVSAGGDTTPVSPNAINIVADRIVEEYPFLSNRKELHISFLGIKKGSKLEYAIELEESPFEYLDGIVYFQEELETEYREIRFCLPKYLTFNFKYWNKEGVSISETVYDSLEYSVYIFSSLNTPPIPEISRWEGHIPSHLYSSFLVYTTFPSWDSLIAYLSHFYLDKEISIKKEHPDIRKVKALSDNISSPEFEPLWIQGYIPFNYDRAISSFKMTFPEKIYRVTQSFKGLMPAFVLKYGFNMNNTPPSLSALESIILFDGKSFINPFRGNTKTFITDFAGYEAITFDSNKNALSKIIENLSEFELKVVINPEQGEAVFAEIMGRLPGDAQLEEDIDQASLRVKNMYERYFGLVGTVKRIKLKLKHVSDIMKPIKVSGKAYFSSLGSKVDKYYIIELPNPDIPIASRSQRGKFILNDEELTKKVTMKVKVPNGYKLVYLPESFYINQPGFESKIQFSNTKKTVIVTYESSFNKRYFTAEEISNIRQSFEANGPQGGRVVVIFEKTK